MFDLVRKYTATFAEVMRIPLPNPIRYFRISRGSAILVLPVCLTELSFLRVSFILTSLWRQRSALNTVYSLLNLLFIAQQIQLSDGALDASQHAVNGTDMICILLVVTPTRRTICFSFVFPLATGRAVTLNDSTIKTLLEGLHDVPFGGSEG